MVDEVETIEVFEEPSGDDSWSDDSGRAFKPKRAQPKERNPKFEKHNEVWFVIESEEEKRAHVMKVRAIKKIEQSYQGRKYVSYQYQLEDSKGTVYENGKWVAETYLEICDGK